MSNIPNALTEKEWEHERSEKARFHGNPLDECTGSTPDACAGLIAINNFWLPDDDARKMTYQWVSDLHLAAANIADEYAEDTRLSAALTEIAHAIQSYLPRWGPLTITSSITVSDD